MIRAGARRRGLLLAVVFALATATAACSSEPGALTITDPADGSTVNASSIVVRGTAPAGARITRNIPMAPDTHANADGDGHWSIAVDLDEGANALEFRLGDDRSTAKTIHVVYDPAAKPSPNRSGSEHGGGWGETGESPVPVETPVPPPSPEATPTSPVHVAEPGIELAAEATADGEPFHVTLGIDEGGNYALRWTAREPFDATGTCAMTIHLYDETGADAGGTKGVSTKVTRPTTGQLDFKRLDAGEYELFVYAGCPWELSFGRP